MRYNVTEVISFCPEQVFEINLIHDISYEEMIDDSIRAEDKLIAAKYPDYTMVTDEQVQEAIKFMYNWRDEHLEKSNKTLEEHKQIALEKIMMMALREKALEDPKVKKFLEAIENVPESD